MKKEWKSLKKIKKLFKVSRNQAIAIYNKSKENQISYFEAYRKIAQTQGLPEIYNEKIEKSEEIWKSKNGLNQNAKPTSKKDN